MKPSEMTIEEAIRHAEEVSKRKCDELRGDCQGSGVNRFRSGRQERRSKMKNCEKYKTEYERIKAHGKYCGNNDKCGTPSQDKCIKCFAHWLDLEAEEDNPLPCPFCGGECRTVKNRYEGFVVGCENCCYCSRDFNSEAEAVAAHNRVCRAVKAAKEGEVK